MQDAHRVLIDPELRRKYEEEADFDLTNIPPSAEPTTTLQYETLSSSAALDPVSKKTGSLHPSDRKCGKPTQMEPTEPFNGRKRRQSKPPALPLKEWKDGKESSSVSDIPNRSHPTPRPYFTRP
jgi:hypothetical protein